MGSDFGQHDLKLVALADCEQGTALSPAAERYGSYFRSAQWSPDGTCLVVNSASSKIQTFIVPPELLDQRESPLELKPYSAIESRDAADAVTCFPGYSLQDVSTTLVLSAVNEHPIRLNSALTGDLVASYPLVNPSTEAYTKPSSLGFTTDGNQIIAGSQNLLSFFDVSRPGSEPLISIKTGPKKGNGSWSNPTLSLRGLVSALALDSQYSVLAAGTLSRQIGLYDSAGQGECIGVFSVADTDADKAIHGNGVTQLAWSDCGRYIYIVERKSDGAMIYDIRQSGQLLSWVCGRNAMTNQRMHVDFNSHANGDGHSIWAGGEDGMLRCWTNAHLGQGSVEPFEALKVHDSLAHSVDFHPSANVILTSSGQRAGNANLFKETDVDVSQVSEQSSLKLWHSSISTAEE